MIYDVIIVGAGASGLFLGANLKGKKVAILEKNSSAGKKILASGGGRCNITNRFVSAKNYLGEQKFIEQILKVLSHDQVLKFFSELKFSEQKQNQFFCDSGAKSVLSLLLKRQNADIFYNKEVVGAKKVDEIFEILTKDEKFRARNLVIASGGLSYKALGASDVGYKIASEFGLELSPTTPALVGFSVQKDEFWFKELSGVSLSADVVINTKIESHKFSNDVLFTHRGISGPAILNASLFWQKGRIYINFLPKFSEKNLVNGKKQLSSVLPLPKRFVLEFLRNFGLKDRAFYEFNDDEKSIIKKLFAYEFAPAGTFGFERAEVTKGGVKTNFLDENLECKSVKGLYFIGEVLDITGMLGGYNLHFAFASALKVASALKNN
ncbi:MAG: aminoacetone oxidase family FAD-binding enzyme [Campylobacter concisus]|uniref:Aminoacetone oxidase family FAD-binding enzyme n=1 Tax=Campylobacter concisus TaxID=199 RepID=A0A9E1F2I2_9BACT|nr:aminoacetone oxidase family FAD-binding enzyme [Campylobacter concisus]